MSKTSLLIVLIINCCNSYAQVNIDSLKRIWNDSTQLDTVRLGAIKKMIWSGYLFSQPDSAYYYTQLQFSFAKHTKHKKYIANAIYIQAIYFRNRSQYAEAMKHYERSLKISQGIGNKLSESTCLNGIGILYSKQGEFNKALDYYYRSLKIRIEHGTKDNVSFCLVNIAQTLHEMGAYSEAIDINYKNLKNNADNPKIKSALLHNIGKTYYKQGKFLKALDLVGQSLKIQEKIGDKYFIAEQLNSLGEIYIAQAEYDKALEYYSKSLEISNRLKDLNGISYSLSINGLIYFKKQDYTKALDFLTRSIDQSIAASNRLNSAISYNRMGDVYYELEDYKNANFYYSKSLQIFQDISSIDNVSSVAKSLWKVYKKTGEGSKALEMLELYIINRDSLYSLDAAKILVENQYKYEYEKKSAIDSVAFVKQQEISDLTISEQNAEIKSTRYFVLFQASILLLGIILATILYRGYKRKIKDHKLIVKQKQSLEQVNNELVNKKDKIEKQAQRIMEANQKISTINESLEQKVKERTAKVQSQNETLRSHAFSISHVLRAPLARLMGLLYIIELSKDNVNEGEQNIMLDKISDSAHELDLIVKNTSELLNKEEAVY